MAAQLLPLMEIATCYLASVRQLSNVTNGGSTGPLLRSMAPQIQAWNQDATLRPRLVHTTSLLPPPDDETSPTVDAVACAFYEDVQSLTAVAAFDEFASNVLDATGKKLLGIIASSRPPAANGAVFRPKSAPPSDVDPVERQMVEALRLYVARAMHDANNTLAPIVLDIQETKRESNDLLKLADAHKEMLPERNGEIEVRAAMMAYVADIGRRVDEIDGLGKKTVIFIRDVQNLIRQTRDVSADFLRIRLLFEAEGLLAQLALVLVDLLTGIGDVDHNVRTLRQMAREYGDYVPGPILQQGLDFLTKIEDHSDTYRSLVKHLVEMFRFLQSVSKDINSLNPEPVDLNAYLNPKTVKMVMGKGIEVFLNLDPGPNLVFGVPIQIWQVLSNLFSNARDAMQDQSKSVLGVSVAAATPEEAQGDFIRLRVEDNGHGIRSDILPRIFEPNFSGKGSSGLGLDATQTIVRQMGGFIVVDTATQDDERRRRGTTFSIFLPRTE